VLYRNIQELDLIKIYQTDPELRHLLRASMALAPLPISLSDEAFELLKETRVRNAVRSMTSFFDYLVY
jgi:hypothetical protein